MYPGDEKKMFLKENEKESENIPSNGDGNKRDVTAFENRLWPDAVLPYEMERKTIGNCNICDFLVFG